MTYKQVKIIVVVAGVAPQVCAVSPVSKGTPMKEVTAKEKTCCGPPAVYAAVAALVAVQTRRTAQGFAGSVTISPKCIGSACMAWRWRPEAQGHGYCGLAGKEWQE